jgi:hypothetical protein
MKVRAKAIVHDRRFDESEHRGLSAGAVYDVIGLDNENFRLIDDNDRPFRFPKALFEIVDPSVPADWVTRTYDDDEYHVDPPECAERGFYEDYFDGIESAVKRFDAFRRRSSLIPKRK